MTRILTITMKSFDRHFNQCRTRAAVPQIALRRAATRSRRRRHQCRPRHQATGARSRSVLHGGRRARPPATPHAGKRTYRGRIGADRGGYARGFHRRRDEHRPAVPVRLRGAGTHGKRVARGARRHPAFPPLLRLHHRERQPASRSSRRFLCAGRRHCACAWRAVRRRRFRPGAGRRAQIRRRRRAETEPQRVAGSDRASNFRTRNPAAKRAAF